MLHNSSMLQVCSGSRHCAALTKDAEVYTWGWNAFGQLGSGSKASSFEPVHVSGLPAKVHDIECGWWHTLFLIDSQVHNPNTER